MRCSLFLSHSPPPCPSLNLLKICFTKWSQFHECLKCLSIINEMKEDTIIWKKNITQENQSPYWRVHTCPREISQKMSRHKEHELTIHRNNTRLIRMQKMFRLMDNHRDFNSKKQYHFSSDAIKIVSLSSPLHDEVRIS